MKKIVLATGNQKKMYELQYIAQQRQVNFVEFLTLHDIPDYLDPQENGISFAENALIKARAGMSQSGLACIADDSGLAVDALNGMPGIFSARWSGNLSVHQWDKDRVNRELLLAQLHDVPENRRQASFICVCAYVTPDGHETLYHGQWDGVILRHSQGDGGFGYDPIFAPFEVNLPSDSQTLLKSAAQLTAKEKNTISHRAQAFHKFIDDLSADS